MGSVGSPAFDLLVALIGNQDPNLKMSANLKWGRALCRIT